MKKFVPASSRMASAAALAFALVLGSFGQPATAVEHEPTPADVGIGKRAVLDGETVTSVEAGTRFRYRIVAWNNGGEPAENVVITDDLDDDLVIVSTFTEVNGLEPPPPGECDVAPGNVVTCDLGTLQAKVEGPADTGWVRIVVDAPEAACGTVSNQATVSASNEGPGTSGDNTSPMVNVDVLCPVDETPPTTSVPAYAFQKGTQAKASKVPVRVSWTGEDDPDGTGVAKYRLQYRAEGAAWTGVSLPSDLARRALVQVAPGSKHQFRVRARDQAGNWSAWRSSNWFTVKARQESAKAIGYSGRWRLGTPSGSYGGAVMHSSTSGSQAVFTFTGRRVAWMSTSGPGRGTAEIYVGGSKVATIDLEAATKSARRLMWTRSWDASAARTVTVKVLGSGERVEVDAFLISN